MSTEMAAAPLSFDQYVGILVAELNMASHGELTEQTGLFDDLGLDSFTTFELVVVTEQLADVTLPPPELPPLFTLGDAYAYYLHSTDSACYQPAGAAPSWTPP